MLEAIANLGNIEAAFREKIGWFEEVTIRADSFAVEVMYMNQKLVLVLPEGEIVLD